MKNINKTHNDVIIRMNYALLKDKNIKDAITLGKLMVELGFDEITDGFWVWQLNSDIEYYSPKFRSILEYKDDKDFPNKPSSWQNAIVGYDAKMAIDAFNKHLNDPDYPYVLEVSYNTKLGNIVNLICSGTIVNRNEEIQFMIGTHELI